MSGACRSLAVDGRPWEVRALEHFVLELVPGANVSHPPFLARAELVGHQLQSLGGDQARVIPHGVYDREIVVAGRVARFFQGPWLEGASYGPEPAFAIDSRFKTLADTNMVAAGCVPKGNCLYVKGVRVWADEEQHRTWLREYAVQFQVSNLIIATFPAVAALHPPNASEPDADVPVPLDCVERGEHVVFQRCACRDSWTVRDGAAVFHGRCGRIGRLAWLHRDAMRACLVDTAALAKEIRAAIAKFAEEYIAGLQERLGSTEVRTLRHEPLPRAC